MNIRNVDLSKLNSLTKYPSIPTYHALDNKGRLTEEVLTPFDAGDKIIVTEKIDGTNARIIKWALGSGSAIIIGSREELLQHRGDLLFNPSQGIVEALKDVQPILGSSRFGLTVVYGEVYGGKIQAAGKMYSPAGRTAFRVFDAFDLFYEEVLELMKCSREEIAHWRDCGKQPFVEEDVLMSIASQMQAYVVPRRPVHEDWIHETAPGVGMQNSIYIDHGPLPTSVKETYEWLRVAAPDTTNAAIDGRGGRPEGIVIRTPDRKKIAKLRFEDYERTLKVKR